MGHRFSQIATCVLAAVCLLIVLEPKLQLSLGPVQIDFIFIGTLAFTLSRIFLNIAHKQYIRQTDRMSTERYSTEESKYGECADCAEAVCVVMLTTGAAFSLLNVWSFETSKAILTSIPAIIIMAVTVNIPVRRILNKQGSHKLLKKEYQIDD